MDEDIMKVINWRDIKSRQDLNSLLEEDEAFYVTTAESEILPGYLSELLGDTLQSSGVRPPRPVQKANNDVDIVFETI